MNQLGKTALCSLAGTTAMTAGSDLMSRIFGENYREPDHLASMIKRLAPGLSKSAKYIAAWGAHYAMGCVFAATFVELWEKRKIKHNIKNALLLGLISGVLGVLIWKGTFKAHPFTPWLHYEHYYLQRIPAHIIFAITATLTYRLFDKEVEDQAMWI